MTVRKLCANEITSVVKSLTERVICATPGYTPVQPGNSCRVALYDVKANLGAVPPTLTFSFDAQIEYQYLNAGATFLDYCLIQGQSGSVDLPPGLTACCGQTVPPTVTYAATCNPGSITTTPTSVSAEITLSFTVSDLCAPTVVCVEDVTC